MIYFFADDHYGVHPGKMIYDRLPERIRKNIVFQENDWTLLESGKWLDDCSLLILNMIGASCGLPHPGIGAEKAVHKWVAGGGNILMLHGSSAAFWQWDWWRKIVGFRWVRPGDPDGVPPSVHPDRPYCVNPAKTRHPLVRELVPLALPEDEVYIRLEQVSPAFILMETRIGEGIFPQVSESITESGGKMVNFIPGHAPEATGNPDLIRNVAVLINYLSDPENKS